MYGRVLHHTSQLKAYHLILKRGYGHGQWSSAMTPVKRCLCYKKKRDIGLTPRQAASRTTAWQASRPAMQANDTPTSLGIQTWRHNHVKLFAGSADGVAKLPATHRPISATLHFQGNSGSNNTT